MKPINGTLAEADAHIGTSVPNCRVLVTNIQTGDEGGEVNCTLLFFWNGAAYQAWKDTRTVLPFYSEHFKFVDDGDTSLRTQAYTALLAQPRFAGWTQPT